MALFPQKKKAKPPYNYDDHCPVCREDIGWDTLAEIFDGRRFDSQFQRQTIDYDCPHCDASLKVQIDVSFAIRATNLDE